MIYVITHGDDEPLTLPDDYSMAQDFMIRTINDLRLPTWRAQALLVQAENMPRAGFSFADETGTVIKIERRK